MIQVKSNPKSVKQGNFEEHQNLRPLTKTTEQQNDLSAMAENNLLDFKANWREFCDHSYFRDLTSNQRRLRK